MPCSYAAEGSILIIGTRNQAIHTCNYDEVAIALTCFVKQELPIALPHVKLCEYYGSLFSQPSDYVLNVQYGPHRVFQAQVL